LTGLENIQLQYGDEKKKSFEEKWDKVSHLSMYWKRNVLNTEDIALKEK